MVKWFTLLAVSLAATTPVLTTTTTTPTVQTDQMTLDSQIQQWNQNTAVTSAVTTSKDVYGNPDQNLFNWFQDILKPYDTSSNQLLSNLTDQLPNYGSNTPTVGGFLTELLQNHFVLENYGLDQAGYFNKNQTLDLNDPDNLLFTVNPQFISALQTSTRFLNNIIPILQFAATYPQFYNAAVPTEIMEANWIYLIYAVWSDAITSISQFQAVIQMTNGLTPSDTASINQILSDSSSGQKNYQRLYFCPPQFVDSLAAKFQTVMTACLPTNSQTDGQSATPNTGRFVIIGSIIASELGLSKMAQKTTVDAGNSIPLWQSSKTVKNISTIWNDWITATEVNNIHQETIGYSLSTADQPFKWNSQSQPTIITDNVTASTFTEQMMDVANLVWFNGNLTSVQPKAVQPYNPYDTANPNDNLHPYYGQPTSTSNQPKTTTSRNNNDNNSSNNDNNSSNSHRLPSIFISNSQSANRQSSNNQSSNNQSSNNQSSNNQSSNNQSANSQSNRQSTVQTPLTLAGTGTTDAVLFPVPTNLDHFTSRQYSLSFGFNNDYQQVVPLNFDNVLNYGVSPKVVSLFNELNLQNEGFVVNYEYVAQANVLNPSNYTTSQQNNVADAYYTSLEQLMTNPAAQMTNYETAMAETWTFLNTESQKNLTSTIANNSANFLESTIINAVQTLPIGDQSGFLDNQDIDKLHQLSIGSIYSGVPSITTTQPQPATVHSNSTNNQPSSSASPSTKTNGTPSNPSNPYLPSNPSHPYSANLDQNSSNRSNSSNSSNSSNNSSKIPSIPTGDVTIYSSPETVNVPSWYTNFTDWTSQILGGIAEFWTFDSSQPVTLTVTANNTVDDSTKNNSSSNNNSSSTKSSSSTADNGSTSKNSASSSRSSSNNGSSSSSSSSSNNSSSSSSNSSSTNSSSSTKPTVPPINETANTNFLTMAYQLADQPSVKSVQTYLGNTEYLTSQGFFQITSQGQKWFGYVMNELPHNFVNTFNQLFLPATDPVAGNVNSYFRPSIGLNNGIYNVNTATNPVYTLVNNLPQYQTDYVSQLGVQQLTTLQNQLMVENGRIDGQILVDGIPIAVNVTNLNHPIQYYILANNDSTETLSTPPPFNVNDLPNNSQSSNSQANNQSSNNQSSNNQSSNNQSSNNQSSNNQSSNNQSSNSQSSNNQSVKTVPETPIGQTVYNSPNGQTIKAVKTVTINLSLNQLPFLSAFQNQSALTLFWNRWSNAEKILLCQFLEENNLLFVSGSWNSIIPLQATNGSWSNNGSTADTLSLTIVFPALQFQNGVYSVIKPTTNNSNGDQPLSPFGFNNNASAPIPNGLTLNLKITGFNQLVNNGNSTDRNNRAAEINSQHQIYNKAMNDLHRIKVIAGSVLGGVLFIATVIGLVLLRKKWKQKKLLGRNFKIGDDLK